ncbi:hypothetical protein WJX84_009177 [Apatococcus fuscideae]|uniref:Uncharacterized protein n=1 Tax=Apatococcus fuscideae TaxID=2026836 RepID=A0AAW1T9H3_9CHLO
MALIVISGLPSSGKSTVSAVLRSALESASTGSEMQVKTVDESLLSLSRDACYQDSASEKNTRGRLKAAVERALTKSSIVIFDSLNNIKGYRYEIWCVARACGCRYCVVHSDVEESTACAWNMSRPGEKYSPEVYKDLAGRYEIPDSKNRWEAPLFRTNPQDERFHEVIQQMVDLTCSSITGTSQKQQHQSQQQNRALQPTVATTSQRLSSTNLLHDFDKASQDVISGIMQSQAGSAPVGTSGGLDLSLNRQIFDLG